MEKEIFDNFLSQVNDDVQQAFEDGDYEKAICCSKFICSLYYEYDYKYYDEQMEEIAIRTAEACIGNTIIDRSDTKKVFFYDKFGLIDRGLANIYVDALLDLGYEVIWCMFENGQQVKQIIERFKSRENIQFELIPNLSVVDRMIFLQKLIQESNAYHYFIYTLPWDVEGIGVFATLSGSIKRYLINLTDHTFWIGTKAIDYSIEFRNIGANISTQYRKIDPEKIVILPYYPDERNEEAYQGMPFPDNEEFVFSGGSAYKIEGSTKYEDMVSQILDRHPKLNFVFATNDESEKLNQLKEKYENRFYVINERTDLDAVLKRAKFYLSTYPVGGGLMTQYALVNNCVPLCLIDQGDEFTNPITWLLHHEIIDFVFTDVNLLLAKVDKLMLEDEKETTDYTCCVISKKEFQKGLQRILQEKHTSYTYSEQELNPSIFHACYEARLMRQSLQGIIQKTTNKWIKDKYQTECTV